MKTKKFRSYLGNNTWSTPVDLGADAANVDYTKGSGQDATSVSVQDELDDLNERVEPYEFDTIAEMNAAIQAGDVREGATIYVKEGSGSESGGHTIQNPSGTSMAQRTNLKFVGASVTDDSTNDATVVTVPDGGHDIIDGSEIEMTKRSGLQFVGATVTDDQTNDKTVISFPNFITNTVSNLVNYYLKTEVDTLINTAKNGRYILVNTLPTEDIDTKAIYLVPKSTSSTNNIKDEYINLDGTSTGWEKIGDTEIDLSGYATTAAMNNMIQVTSTDPGEGAAFTGKLLVVVEE